MDRIREFRGAHWAESVSARIGHDVESSSSSAGGKEGGRPLHRRHDVVQLDGIDDVSGIPKALG